MARKTMKKYAVMKKLGRFIKSVNVAASNQVVLYFEKGKLFLSYAKTIAAKIWNKWYFDPYYHDYSTTTMKYMKQFTGLSSEQRYRMLASGEAISVDFN